MIEKTLILMLPGKNPVQQLMRHLVFAHQRQLFCPVFRDDRHDVGVCAESGSGDAQAVENARHALELVLRLAQGRTPAGTKPLTAAQQHDTAVLDALDAAFLSE